MKTWWAVAFGILGGLLGAGLLLLASRPPLGAAVALQPPPTRPPLQIYVSGAVATPGVYALPEGSRVHDLLLAAGGASGQADLQKLNLAALLQDSERVNVPTLPPTHTPAPPTATRDPRQTAAPPTPVPASTGLVNINTASLQELDTLPGIGPATAQKIIDYRLAHGSFETLEAIQEVPGIGPATFERLKDLITLDGSG